MKKNNMEDFPKYMKNIVSRARKDLQLMQGYVLNNSISQISFIQYFSLIKALHNNSFIDYDEILSYANSLVNAHVYIKNEDVYNQIVVEINNFIENIISLKEENLGR